MVALADPNQVLQTALGGQNAANNFTASTVGPMLGDLVGNAPAPVPQQTELPEINIDALRKISDPRIMQMAFNMLMHRDAMKARQRESVPFHYTQLPKEKWGKAAAIEAGIEARAGSLQPGAANIDLTELAKWQTIAKNATESVTDKYTGKTETRTRPGQQGIIRLAERNIAAIEKRMTAEAARELGVSQQAIESANPATSVEERKQNIQAISKLAEAYSAADPETRQGISAAIRNGHPAATILASLEQ